MDILEQKRCIDCGEFYHLEAMKGELCYACAEKENDILEYHDEEDYGIK